MGKKEILIIGKSMFWGSFTLGNICLFGYLLTKDDFFAGAGYTLLVLGSILNLIVICCLLIYGLTNQDKLDICLKSIAIILTNIPIAIVYAMIGINIIEI